jgi:uncharacterized membrane protein
MLLGALTLFHVATGAVVLVVAPAALLTRKGGRWHRRWGIVFAAAMAAVLGTAAFMWQPHGHVFLLVLDVVCAYLVFESFRALRRSRRKTADAAANALDLAAASLVLLSAGALFVLAATAQTALMRGIAGILVALGAIAAIFAGLDFKAVVMRAQTRPGALLVHVSATIAAYISAVTAFCVINFHGVPMTLRWVVPSALGSTVIAYFSIQCRRRFAKKKPPATLHTLEREVAG